jgi:hypothetical protein
MKKEKIGLPLRPVSVHNFIARVPRLGTRYCDRSFMLMKLISHMMKLSLLSHHKCFATYSLCSLLEVVLDKV